MSNYQFSIDLLDQSHLIQTPTARCIANISPITFTFQRNVLKLYIATSQRTGNLNHTPCCSSPLHSRTQLSPFIVLSNNIHHRTWYCYYYFNAVLSHEFCSQKNWRVSSNCRRLLSVQRKLSSSYPISLRRSLSVSSYSMNHVLPLEHPRPVPTVNQSICSPLHVPFYPLY